VNILKLLIILFNFKMGFLTKFSLFKNIFTVINAVIYQIEPFISSLWLISMKNPLTVSDPVSIKPIHV